MRKTLLIMILVLALFSISAQSQTLHLDPDLYFVVADNPIGSDLELRDSIVNVIDDQIDLDIASVGYRLVTDSQLKASKLSRSTAIVVHKGEVLVISGDDPYKPPRVAQTEASIVSILISEFGITPQQISKSAVVTDDLISYIALPSAEVVFVLDDLPSLSDDMILRGVVDQVDPFDYNITPASFLLNSQVGQADLFGDKLTMFVHHGEVLLVVGDTAPTELVLKAIELAVILNTTYGILPNASLASEVSDDDLTLVVKFPDAPTQNPEIRFVLDEPRTQFDTLIFEGLTDILKKQSPYDLEPLSYYLNSDVGVNELDYGVTLFLSAGNAYMITGDNSPVYQSVDAQGLTSILESGFGLMVEQHLSSDITTDNYSASLVATVVAPPGGIQNPELLFVVDDNPTFADQALLAFIVEELETTLDLDNRVNNYALRVNSNVTKEELDYRVTVFVYKGEVLIVTGVHSPKSNLDLADEVADAISDGFEIASQRKNSEAIIFDDLKQEVALYRLTSNSLSFLINITSAIGTSTTGSFITFDAGGNTSGAVIVESSNISALDGSYEIGYFDKEFAENVFGTAILSSGQITGLYLEVQNDKLQSWAAIGDILQKTYVFDSGDGTIMADNGTINITLRLDSIASFNKTYDLDLVDGSVIGDISIDPTDLLSGLVEVRELSLRGTVYKALGDLQLAGSLVAFGNLGTFIAPIVNGRYFIDLVHEAVGDHFFFKVSHVEAYNSTLPPDKEPPMALSHDLVVNQTQRGAYVNLVDVPRQLQYPHYLDSDLDGVPDQIDICLGTNAQTTLTTVTSNLIADTPYLFEDNGTVLQLNDSLAQFKDVLTSTELPMLLSSSNVVSSTTHQYLRFEEPTGADSFASNLSIYYGLNAQNETSEFLHAKDSELLFEYELEFENGFQSSIVSNKYLVDLENMTFSMLGQQAQVYKAGLFGNQLSLGLIVAPIFDTLVEGDSKTYVLNGTNYDVQVVGFDLNNTEVHLLIDGWPINLGASGGQRLGDGTWVQGMDVRLNPVAEADIAFGGQLIDFEDTFDDDQYDGTADVDGQQVDGAFVSMRGVMISNDTFELDTIKYRLEADVSQGDLYVKKQTSVSEYLVEPQGMLTDNWDILFYGDTPIIFKLVAGQTQPPIGYYVQVTGGAYTQTTNTQTFTTTIDAFGCSCAQKNCAAEGLGCVEDMGVAVCVPTCTDGFKNGLEDGPDCGAVCGVGCGPTVCDTPFQCLGNAPGYCSENYTMAQNCQQCGCPSDQICTGDGSCSGRLPPHCSNGVFDGDERGLDCGGSCFGFCPGDDCDAADTCLIPQPAYCNSLFKVEFNCGGCGCPTNFNCDVGTGACISPPITNMTCNDGIQNGDETGIDCGGSCSAFCPGDQCFTPDQCLGSQPLFCDTNAIVQNNCQSCGCPGGFSCQPNGECLVTLGLLGTKCASTEFFDTRAVDCAAVAGDQEDYRLERAQDFVSAKLVGNLAGWLGKDKYNRRIKREIRKTNLCFREVDMGCVLPEFQCPMETYFDESKPNLEYAIGSRIKSTLRKSIPGFYKNWPFNLRARVKVSLASLQIESNYACEDQVVSASKMANGVLTSNTCQKLVDNGDYQDKIDILFIGDGFSRTPEGETEFLATVNQMIDYDGVREGTPYEGLFSLEPFKSRKTNFNIWTMNAPRDITYSQSSFDPLTGFIPEYKDTLEMSNLCPQRDMVVLVTPKPFRSHCFLGYPGPCQISLFGEQFTGRLLSHELGHGLGLLADEYFEPVEYSMEGGFITISEGMIAAANAGPNCQVDQASAQAKWSNLVDDDIGYFQSCGGVCTSSCGNFIRPTVNSVMNDQRCKLGTEDSANADNDVIASCESGPPFRPWYGVNEEQIIKVIDNTNIIASNAVATVAPFRR